nr:TetR/AcrR family transcriptional regulator [Gordonia soli]
MPKSTPDGVRSPGSATAPTGRPRDRRIDAAILDAARELVVQVGYPSLSLAAIADRAGTTTAAIYRRWSGKAEVVHDAVFPPTVVGTVPPPTGDVESDVRRRVEIARDLLATPEVLAALPGLIADMTADRELHARVMARFGDIFTTQAHDETDQRAAVGDDVLLETVIGATMFRLLVRPDAAVDAIWVDELTALVVRGVGSG